MHLSLPALFFTGPRVRSFTNNKCHYLYPSRCPVLRSDMTNTAASLSIRLLDRLTQPSHFSFCLFPLFPLPVPPVLQTWCYCGFSLSSSITDKSILQTLLPVCQWQLLVQGSPLCQVGCPGRGLQSSSEKVAHPHRSKRMCTQICKTQWKHEISAWLSFWCPIVYIVDLPVLKGSCPLEPSWQW